MLMPSKSRKNRFSDVTEAVRLLFRKGARISLKEKTIQLPMKSRGLKTLSAVDMVKRTYDLELI